MACCQQDQPWPKECRVAKGHLTQGTEQHPLNCYPRIEGERNECYKKAASKVTKRGAQRPLCTRPIGDFSVCIFIWSGARRNSVCMVGICQRSKSSSCLFSSQFLLIWNFFSLSSNLTIDVASSAERRRINAGGHLFLEVSQFFSCTQVWPSKFSRQIDFYFDPN